MTEYAPEQVADLIARASGRVHAHAEFSRRMGGQGLRLAKLYEEHAELATALEAASAERDAAIRDLDAGFAESDHLSAKYYQRMRDAEALAQKANLSIIGLVRMANERADERDEALAVIAELQKGIQRFDGAAYYAEAREILSRIPEHPKED